jgi:hypothetical protein
LQCLECFVSEYSSEQKTILVWRYRLLLTHTLKVNVSFKNDLVDNNFSKAFNLDHIAKEIHTLVSTINPHEIMYLKRDHPEFIMIASKYGTANDLRDCFDCESSRSNEKFAGK